MKLIRRPRRPVVLALSALFILISIFVGHRAWRTRHDQGAPHVRVLCAEDWLEPAALDRFARDFGVKIDLYTYTDVAEMLRQLANSDGRIDVICTSSLLLRSLVRSHWIRRDEFADLAHEKGIAADFVHLPFDPSASYAAPLHWLAFGFLSARPVPDGGMRALQAKGRVGVWASDLNLMALLTQAGVSFEERLESEGVKRLEDDVLRFVNSIGLIAPDLNRAQVTDWLKHFDFAHVPSVTVPAGTKFTPGDEGGVLDVGVLAIGERATSPELARALIARLIEPTVAVDSALRLKRGTVHAAGESDARVTETARASALRGFELTRLRFPDVYAEATLKFARTFANARGKK